MLFRSAGGSAARTRLAVVFSGARLEKLINVTTLDEPFDAFLEVPEHMNVPPQFCLADVVAHAPFLGRTFLSERGIYFTQGIPNGVCFQGQSAGADRMIAL